MDIVDIVSAIPLAGRRLTHRLCVINKGLVLAVADLFL